MKPTRRIIFAIFPGFEILDFSGPVAVFANADNLLPDPAYEIVVVSSSGGLVPSSAGPACDSLAVAAVDLVAQDTLLVVGGDAAPLADAMADSVLAAWLQQAATVVARFGSICSGAFVAAAAGILDGRRVTTHWLACAELARRFPALTVDAEALYVVDDTVWTSAGVTAGIDMALAMLARDHGATLMGHVARVLVVYAHRPGNQSQFSALLGRQLQGGDDFEHLPPWLVDNLHRPLRVADMAAEVGMSERSFYRRFTEAFGETPAKFLERLRLEQAKALLARGNAVKMVTDAVGFRSEAAFRSAFRNRYGLTPAMHQRLHGSTETGVPDSL